MSFMYATRQAGALADNGSGFPSVRLSVLRQTNSKVDLPQSGGFMLVSDSAVAVQNHEARSMKVEVG